MITEEEREKIRRYAEAKNKAFRINANEVTDLYNKILNKTARYTNCGSCIRARVCDLERYLRQYEIDEKKELEKSQQKVEEVKEETKPKKKRGRPKKKEE